MKRRLFSLSLLSALSTLPAAVRRFLASPVEKTGEAAAHLRSPWSQTQPRPAGTVTLLPVGFDGLPLRVAPVSKEGKVLTQSVNFDITPPGGPQIRVEIQVPLIKITRFPPIPLREAFRLVEGALDFGAELGLLAYRGIVVQPDRAWAARGVRVAAVGEQLAVRTVTGEEAPLIVTEELGFSPLLQVSSALRRFLEQQGVNINEIVQNAMTPNLRQRVLQTTGGVTTFLAPDPPLPPELIQPLGAIQVTVWAPVPITVIERVG